MEKGDTSEVGAHGEGQVQTHRGLKGHGLGTPRPRAGVMITVT